VLNNVLSPSEQLYWAKQALEDYSNAEHTNIELLRPNEECKIGERVSLDG
jgi:hypothetical protein